MARRNWSRTLGLLAIITILSTGTALFAQRGQRSGAQKSDEKPTAKVRFGRWKMEQNAAPPVSNIMTYEPFGDGGMKVTVATVNAQGQKSQWSYETLFDGVFRPVTGQEGSETAVEFINAKSTRIQNKRNGKVNQVVINTLTEDNNTINNEYVRLDDQGRITGVTHAVYHRIME